MRRDTQIGIIVGAVILVIIGVFLSTRSSVEKPETPELILSEKDISNSEIEEIDISEIIKESKTETVEKATSAEDSIEKSQIKEELAKETLAEQPAKYETLVEGKWEGVETEAIEPVEVISETPVAESPIEQQTASVDIHGETIHKVKSNDNLFKIAREYYGDEAKWKRIYEANKDNMLDPDALYIDQELLIPDITLVKKEKESQVYETIPLEEKPDKEISTSVRTHTVEPGDTLYNLARKYYDDPVMWKKNS